MNHVLMIPKNNLKKWLIESVWIFPAVLFILLILLTIFRISGTSIGVYHEFFYGPEAQDRNLLAGKPRPIRSDEWLVMTQLTLAQKEAGYPRINENFGEGRDMSVILDVPYKEWSIIFKPQNLAFLVLPFEYAFAFKWWLLLVLLLISSYFVALRFFPKERLLSSLFAVGVSMSPFVFWWYQTATLATLFYSFFILLTVIKIIDQDSILFIKRSWLRDLLYIGLLGYLTACFALVMYPPFQIPAILVVCISTLGYLFNSHFSNGVSLIKLAKRCGLLVIGILISALVVGIFAATRLEAIQKVNNSVYPGAREVTSGGIDPLHVFDGFLMPQLQLEPQGQNFFNNQSESSNFILLLPFLLVPGSVVLYLNYKKTGNLNWMLLFMQALSILFLARIFVPFGDLFYKPLLLDKVPHERLIFGIGLLGSLHLLVLAKEIRRVNVPRILATYIYSALCLIIVFGIGLFVLNTYPAFIKNLCKLFLFSGVFTMIILLVLRQKILHSFALLAIFCILSVYSIHPLYVGMGVIGSSKITSFIEKQSSKKDTLVGANSIVIENFGLIAGRDSISGVNFYPDIDYWRQIDGKNYDDIHNRYAHILFSSELGEEPIRLIQPDSFFVSINCSRFFIKEVEFVVSSTPLENTCLNKIDVVNYPALSLYMYKVIK